MLEYDRTVVPQGLGFSIINGSHEYSNCYRYCFPQVNFRFQGLVCDGRHDIMQKTMNFDIFFIVTVKGNDYKIHFVYMRKDEAMLT